MIFSTQCVAYAAHIFIPSAMTTLELHDFSHVINDTNWLSTLKHGNVSLGVACVCVWQYIYEIMSVYVHVCVCLCLGSRLGWPIDPNQGLTTVLVAHDHLHHCPKIYINYCSTTLWSPTPLWWFTYIHEYVHMYDMCMYFSCRWWPTIIYYMHIHI